MHDYYQNDGCYDATTDVTLYGIAFPFELDLKWTSKPDDTYDTLECKILE